MRKRRMNPRGWYGDDNMEMAAWHHLMAADDKAAASAAGDDTVGIDDGGEGKGEDDSKKRYSFHGQDQRRAATGVSGKPLFDPRNLSSNIGILPARPKSVNACVSKMREIGFSESIVSLTEEEFKYRKPGTWTKEDLFAFACHFAGEKDAKPFASDQHSVDEDETNSNVRPSGSSAPPTQGEQVSQKKTDQIEPRIERGPGEVRVEGRVSIGKAVFTIDCELVLSVENEPHCLQIKYKRVDNIDAPEICHKITEEDVVEMRLFEYRQPIPKGQPKKYLTLRANATGENGLREYYGRRTYRPVRNSHIGRTTDEWLKFANYITFEIGIGDDDNIAVLENALKYANFGATNHIDNLLEANGGSGDIGTLARPSFDSNMQFATITGAGFANINGIYNKTAEICDGLPVYRMQGSWRDQPCSYCLFRCELSNGKQSWYISYVPQGIVPGTTKDVDFYNADPVGKSDFPPKSGWRRCAEGVDPPPNLWRHGDTPLQNYVGAFQLHNDAAEEAPIEMSDGRIPRISVGNKVYSTECNLVFLPNVGFPSITVSYEQDNEQVKHVIFARSIVDLYMTPAKLPPPPSDVPGKTRYYVVMDVNVDEENRLPSAVDEDDSESTSVDDKIIVIEVDQKPDYKRLFRALSSDPGFRSVAHEGLKPLRSGPKGSYKAIMRDLAPMARDNQRKTKLKGVRHLVAHPKDFDQRQRQCFLCNREHRYFNDGLVVMMPCCGALACIKCREKQIIHRAMICCQCGFLETSDDTIAEVLRDRLETEPYAQYIMGIYFIGWRPDIEIAVSIPTTIHEEGGADLIQRAAKNKYVPACRTLAAFHLSGALGMKEDIEEAISILLSVKDAGDPLVSFDLAKIFLDKKEKYSHIKHLKMASELGHGEARGMFGRLYWGSKLKSKDEIAELFLFAVANSEPRCRGTYSYHLASLSREKGNNKQYLHWLRAASGYGHSVASYELGAYSLLGRFCARDHVLARVYLERAMTQDPESKMAEELVIRHFKSTDESSYDEESI